MQGPQRFTATGDAANCNLFISPLDELGARQSHNGDGPPHHALPTATVTPELFQAILAAAPIGTLLYTSTGQCLYANATAATLLGIAHPQLVQQNFYDLAPWQACGLAAQMQAVINSGQATQCVSHFVGAFDKELWLEVRISPLTAACYLVVITDITRQKIADLELAVVQAHQEEMITTRTIDLQTANLLLRGEVTTRQRAEEKLQRQAILLQNVSDAIIATDLHFNITEWNRAAEKLYGWRAEETIGKSIYDIIDTQYIGQTPDQVMQQFIESGDWHGEVIQQQRNGQSIHVLASVNLLKDQQGREIGMVAVNRDITASRQTEDQLLTLSSAIEQSPVCVIITGTSGTIEYVNPKFTQLTGYTFEEVRGKNPRILKSGETTPEEYKRLWHTITSGGQWEGELHNKAKDGRLFWEHARISPIVNRGGEITHFVAIKEDISERKQQETVQNALLQLAMALRSANGREAMLPAILQQSAQLVDAPTASYTTFDQARYSFQVEAILSNGEVDCGFELPLVIDEACCAEVLEQGKPWVLDDITQVEHLPLRDFIGDERAMACIPLVTHGETLGILCVLRQHPFTPDEVRLLVAVADMAAVALQRAALHDRVVQYTTDLETEVAKRTRELAEANARLQELDQLKSKFVSDVTHELRTPVTNIGLYIKLLERKPEKLPEYVSVLSDQAERLRVLVKDTLDLSRLDHQRESLNIARVDLNALACAVVSAHAARADEQGLKLNFQPAPYLPPLHGDRDKLTQVLTNLVANALNYTPQGEITVATSHSNSRREIRCEVHDTGCGIYAEDLPHLFDRFYRGKRDKIAPVPGTGLGLSIVKEIVEMHGGNIEVASQVGVGSTFTVTLPLAN